MRLGRSSPVWDISERLFSWKASGLRIEAGRLYHNNAMAFPIRVCVVCSEEFELRPGKPGFANRCPACSEPESTVSKSTHGMDADERKSLKEANEARRGAMRDLLYRKDG